jgi:hypothetical protein
MIYMLFYLFLSHAVRNISTLPTKRGKLENARHKTGSISMWKNLPLKDAVEKVIFYEPILNTEVSVSDILRTIQRFKRHASRAEKFARCCAGEIS